MSDALRLDDLAIRPSSPTPFFGAYLATQAISDALCMCHASVGCKVKTELHYGRHDGVDDGHDRRRYSQLIDEDLIGGSTEQLEEEIEAWLRRRGSSLVVIDPSTPVALQGQPMGPLLKRIEETTGQHAIAVPGQNSDDDLFVGYAQVIGAVLERQDWRSGGVSRDEVSIVGNLFHRYEADCQGDVAELRRMLFALGLKAHAVFMAGEPYANLQRVVRARGHVVLPYAGRAAKLIRRKGREAVSTALPMSISGTRRWLEQVGEHLVVPRQRLDKAIGRELRRVAPLADLSRQKLSERSFAVFAEAPRAAGLVATLMEVGMVPALIGVSHFSLGGREEVEASLRDVYELEPPDGVSWLEDPTDAELRAAASLEPTPDVAIGSSVERQCWPSDMPWVELGFPAVNRHHLFPAPSLGFNGALRLLEQVMTALEAR